MHMGTGFANGQMHTGTGSALVGLMILMYHKIHDCKEEDIGVSDYNRLRIQHIRKTVGYRTKGPVHASLTFFNSLIPVYI